MTINAGVRYDRYKGWLPEQEQMAGTQPVGRVPSLAGRETLRTRRDLYTWNVVRAAHRRGLST